MTDINNTELPRIEHEKDFPDTGIVGELPCEVTIDGIDWTLYYKRESVNNSSSPHPLLDGSYQ